MNLKLRKKLFAVGASFVLLTGIVPVFAGENAPKRVKRAEQRYDIKVRTWGPTQADVDAAKARVEKSAPVQAALKGVKYRLMSLDYIETEANKPTRYRVTFYDYTNDRVFIAESDFAAREPVKVREENYAEADAVFAPGVSSEELFDAFEMVKDDAELAAFYKQGKLQTYDAMPPITMIDSERLVNIGITKNGVEQVVGVSFKNNRVVYYENGAPPTSKAAPESCGIGNSGQVPSPNGTPGQFQLSVFAAAGQQPLWEMLVIRPAASSGNPSERSGIEIRDVKYKGKSVLKRGHVPVLNVEYANNVCGPFRDWQYQEGPFDAPEAGAENPAPGIRILAQGQIAKTALDSGIDQGNFRGVAVYQQNVGNGTELVMVSEMNAGWYRYIMEWRFAPDGTIRPRYGFGSTKNACVCSAHQHNAYWRFDFDIVNPTNKIFQIERGRKFLKPITREANVLRNYATNRGFVIQNSTGDEAYSITASRSDGNADTFGIGDFWLLKHKGTAAEPLEIDDENTGSAANFAPWLDNESLVNQDVVVWYSAHYIHNDGSELLAPDRSGQVLTGSHVVGPVLRPIRW
jgi:hypothetical protein